MNCHKIYKHFKRTKIKNHDYHNDKWWANNRTCRNIKRGRRYGDNNIQNERRIDLKQHGYCMVENSKL